MTNYHTGYPIKYTSTNINICIRYYIIPNNTLTWDVLKKIPNFYKKNVIYVYLQLYYCLSFLNYPTSWYTKIRIQISYYKNIIEMIFGPYS